MIEHQTNTSPETPSVDTQEYIDKMVAVAEGKTQEPQGSVEENKLYAGKYKSIEELEKGYQELQKAYSSRGKETTVEETATEETSPTKKNPLEIETTTDEEAATETLEAKGLDIATFNQEYQEKGALSEASYTTLEKAGIPKDIVDAYIEGQQLKANMAVTRVYDTVGGAEEYSKITQWALNNLPKSDVDAYNRTMQGEDVDQIILAVRGLKATYEDKFGKTPQLITGDSSIGSGTGEGYTSLAQMKADMSDPRYSKDPAFRKEVEMKVQRSSLF